MSTPVLPLTSDHACACGEAAVWATRRGPQCDGCVHPAHRRIALAAAREHAAMSAA